MKLKKILGIGILSLLLMGLMIGIVEGAYSTERDYSMSADQNIYNVGAISPETAFPNARISCANETLKWVVYTAWGTSHEAIYVSESDAYDRVWTKTKVYENTTYNVSRPSMAMDSNDDLHIIFEMNVSNVFNIYYMNNTAGTWSTPTLASNQTGWNDTIPAIAIDSNDVAHYVWQSYNTTAGYTNCSNIMYGNSTSFGNTTIKGDLTPIENWYNISYLYPSIGINSTDGIFVSYHWVNTTLNYFRLGVLRYDEVTATVNNTMGWNQTRNGCLAIDSDDDVVVVCKGYNETAGTSNLTYYVFDQDLVVDSTGRLEAYTNASYLVYPSVAISSTDEILTSVTSTHVATSVNNITWFIQAENTTVTQNGTIFGSGTSRAFIFAHQRWSQVENNQQDDGDMVVLWSDGVQRISYFGLRLPTLPESGDWRDDATGDGTSSGDSTTGDSDDSTTTGILGSSTASSVIVALGIAVLVIAGLMWVAMKKK